MVSAPRITTYDRRRDQNVINPRTHADIMVLASEEDVLPDAKTPYWYARVLGIYHTNVSYKTGEDTWSEPERLEFLHVRWFGRAGRTMGGFRQRRPPRIGFVPEDDDEAFGFVDPAQVIRGAHIIPAFKYGYSDEECTTWRFFYVNM